MGDFPILERVNFENPILAVRTSLPKAVATGLGSGLVFKVVSVFTREFSSNLYPSFFETRGSK